MVNHFLKHRRHRAVLHTCTVAKPGIAVKPPIPSRWPPLRAGGRGARTPPPDDDQSSGCPRGERSTDEAATGSLPFDVAPGLGDPADAPELLGGHDLPTLTPDTGGADERDGRVNRTARHRNLRASAHTSTQARAGPAREECCRSGSAVGRAAPNVSHLLPNLIHR